MSRQIGTWVYDNQSSLGDAVKTLRMEIKDDLGVPWGAAVGLGWTPTLEIRKVGEAALYLTVTGAWEDATEGAALFQLGTETLLVPTDGTQSYEAQLILTFPGMLSVHASDDQSDTYTFSVRRWP